MTGRLKKKLVIKGGRPLRGELEVKGYKNAAGSILAATLLTEDKCVIDNLPLVSDISGLLKILEGMGSKIDWLGKRKIRITNKDIDPAKINFEEIGKSRVSVLLLGPLLARFKSFRFASPGGDRIGLRPITTHLLALKELGGKFFREGNFYLVKRKKELRGKEIFLREFSVTATETLMMASALARGKTTIHLAAAEPQVQDTARFLKKMGARIEGIGSHCIRIEGARKLNGAFHRIIPDPLEAGTFIIASAITAGRVRIKNVVFEHLFSFLDKLKEVGVKIKRDSSNSLIVLPSSRLRAASVQALPFPGFPTDLLPLLIPLLAQATGRSRVHDPLYENRFNFTQELRKMGAGIEVVDPHRLFVFGKTKLLGTEIESWDIRAGASLIIAGLSAEGRTIIGNIAQIDRGYEKIEKCFQKVGADIKRI